MFAAPGWLGIIPAGPMPVVQVAAFDVSLGKFYDRRASQATRLKGEVDRQRNTSPPLYNGSYTKVFGPFFLWIIVVGLGVEWEWLMGLGLRA